MVGNNISNRAAEGLGVWEHFTIQDGLPDMKIECVYEDNNGVLWIGTHHRGVVRYEGDVFKSYTQRDGLIGNNVFSVIEDGSGCLWFGTQQGLSRFDGAGFETVDIGEACSFLWGSCMDTGGNLWFGMERRPGKPAAVCKWDGVKIELINISDEVTDQGQSIHQIVLGANGNIWLGGDKLYRYD